MKFGSRTVIKRILYFPGATLSLLVFSLFLISSFFVTSQAVMAQTQTCRVTQITDTDTDNSNNPIDNGPSIDDIGNLLGFSIRGTIDQPNIGDNAEVYILDVLSNDLTQVTNTPMDANFNATISSNGQYLAFESAGDILGPNPGNNQQIYLYSVATGVITQITNEPAGDSDGPAINADGSIISFRSGANINGGNPSGNLEMFYWNSATNTITQITETPNAVGTGDAGLSSVDAAGNLISFFSTADINGNNPDNNQEIYIYNVVTATLTQITDTTIGDSGVTWLNGPGTLMAFSSNANLPNGDPHAVVNPPSPFINTEIWLYDITTGDFTQITHTLPGENSNRPQISSDSQFISFDSTANINGGNPTGNRQVFIYGMESGQFTQITNSSIGQSVEAAINGDGTSLVFQSTGNLTGGNIDGNEEIFLAGCSIPADVPTIGEIGLITIAIVFGVVGFVAIRRRNLTA